MTATSLGNFCSCHGIDKLYPPVQGAASTAPKKKGFMSGGGLVSDDSQGKKGSKRSKSKQTGVRVLPNGDVANAKCYTFGAGEEGPLLAQMARRQSPRHHPRATLRPADHRWLCMALAGPMDASNVA